MSGDQTSTEQTPEDSGDDRTEISEEEIEFIQPVDDEMENRDCEPCVEL